MEWLFANPKLLIAAIIICGWAIRLLLQKKSDGPEVREDDEGGLHRPTNTPQVDPAEAERTRRIQEEIRRKIIERQRGTTVPPPMPQPQPVQQRSVVVVQRHEQEPEYDYQDEGPAPLPPPLPPPPAPAVMPSFDAGETEALIARQRQMLEQLQMLQAQRAAGLKGEVGEIGGPVMVAVPDLSSPRGGVRSMLLGSGGGGGLRQAILLREILGEPPGLQTGPLTLPRR